MSAQPGALLESAQSLILSAPTLVPHREPTDAAFACSLVDAAADAGFSGLSIWTDQHDWAVADGMSSEEFFARHRERGLSTPASEVHYISAADDARSVAQAHSHMLEVAAAAQARSVIAVTLEPRPEQLPSFPAAIVPGVRALCDLAADRGLKVSFEYMPFTGVATTASIVQLLEAVDRDNLGIVLDTWHWFRQPGGPDVAALRSIPPERIHIFQLNDAPARPPEDIMLECVSARLLPGTGAIDILELLRVVDDMGAAPVVVSEVFSHELSGRGPAESARRQYGALSAVLDRYRASRGLAPAGAS